MHKVPFFKSHNNKLKYTPKHTQIPTQYHSYKSFNLLLTSFSFTLIPDIYENKIQNKVQKCKQCYMFSTVRKVQ